MKKGRLEAFSDGVLAIIITIMVLEMKVPHGTDFEALKPLLPVFMSYVLSFIYLGIYWNNHHHLMQAVERVNGTILWANMHLLFWLSLVPFSPAFLQGCALQADIRKPVAFIAGRQTRSIEQPFFIFKFHPCLNFDCRQIKAAGFLKRTIKGYP